MASRKKRFFYIIITNHFFLYKEKYVRRLGYGVTDAPGSRVRKYSTTAGGEQEFCKLWYSPTFKAEVLEDIIKERVSSETHKINGEFVEWISPESNMTVEDLTSIIEEVIEEFSKLDLRSVKSEYLPFNDSEWQKEINHEDINHNLDKYLEKI